MSQVEEANGEAAAKQDVGEVASASGAPASDASESAAQASVESASQVQRNRHDPDNIRRAFETGEFPYSQKIRQQVYEKHKAEL